MKDASAGRTQPLLSRSAGQSGAFSLALDGLIAIVATLGIGRFVYTPILSRMITARRCVT